MDFNNVHNSYPKMSVKQPIAHSCAVLFTSTDKLHIRVSSLRLCHLVYRTLYLKDWFSTKKKYG